MKYSKAHAVIHRATVDKSIVTSPDGLITLNINH